jgi:hypothetical protein
MSVVAGIGPAAGAERLTGARLAGMAFRRTFPRTKRALVVVAVALLGLATFAALIPASLAPNGEHHYSAGSMHDQAARAAAPVSEPAVPKMSERGPRRLWEAPARLRPKRGPDR